MKVAVIGCGHWGRNYVRVFAGLLGNDRVVAVDSSPTALNSIRTHFNGIGVAADLRDALADKSIGMAVVATPASRHADIIRRCLLAGWDVLAEKPLTLKVAQARQLAVLARRKQRILMVGHTFLYNPAVRKVRELVRKGVCGQVYYMKAVRTHLGLVRPDVNAVWDLAPHDVAIFNYLIDTMPVAVSALGGAFLRKDKEDMAFITLQYPRQVLASIHVSWADSNKERTVAVVGSRARVLFDDLNALERVKVFEKGISTNLAGGDTFGEFLFALRDGNIFSPKVPTTEPLIEVCKEFLRCVRTRREPFTGADNAVAVVQVMCAIERSLKQGGKRVLIR